MTSKAPRRILVVEDEDLIQLLIASHLEALGFEASLAGSAAEAKAQLEVLCGAVAAAVIDMALPDGKGDALVRELRVLYPGLPVVISSGYDPKALQPKFLGLTAIDYLSKPFSREQLRAALDGIGVNP
jgi:DNA-binding response OmpR family regulator